ncbi:MULTISPECIES: AAA family ATPase [unclassified Oceanispirochaeta]|uniref:cytidylate kinase-like family protein n=1 Tax=unclassified Oceanispirochaeta TaxID=2635722 RepID=UPI000E0972C4|nr:MULTISPECIES: cytidylate kinase-like family protein [unclassified Oceanispirochaeta]MBF9016970.1 cytidylate kinase-like family protein [Oceanispirochaeta sp. M2]NPD73333.1 cytidylate kinase-like family protein [Oceanispirochaeta sp. M1]RDG30993.1 cytidylate kinase-like family protein [Oceanispirochaeta sp. M1]
MAVITISRKLGSMGTYVGRKLAEKLGYDYIDKNHLSKIMKEYGFSKFDNIYDTIPSMRERYDEYREMTINFLAEVILAVAQHDNVVIAGRGSFGLLDSYSDVINIRIKAPESCRVHRIMEDRNLSDRDARTLVRENDKVRRSFVESDFRFDYNNSTEFDLILDTSIIPPDLCVDWISQAYDVTNGKRDDDRPSVKTLNIEKVLAKHVSEMLERFRENKEVIENRTEE